MLSHLVPAFAVNRPGRQRWPAAQFALLRVICRESPLGRNAENSERRRRFAGQPRTPWKLVTHHATGVDQPKSPLWRAFWLYYTHRASVLHLIGFCG